MFSFSPRILLSRLMFFSSPIRLKTQSRRLSPFLFFLTAPGLASVSDRLRWHMPGMQRWRQVQRLVRLLIGHVRRSERHLPHARTDSPADRRADAAADRDAVRVARRAAAAAAQRGQVLIDRRPSERALVSSLLSSPRFVLLRFASLCLLASLCFALLRFASLCFALLRLCFALLRFASFCFALRRFALLCIALRSLCFALLRFASPCFALLRFASLCFACFALLRFASLCFALLRFASLCFALLRFAFALLRFASLCFALLRLPAVMGVAPYSALNHVRVCARRLGDVSGGQLMIDFDAETDRGGYGGSSFACHELLEFPLASVSSSAVCGYCFVHRSGSAGLPNPLLHDCAQSSRCSAETDR